MTAKQLVKKINSQPVLKFIGYKGGGGPTVEQSTNDTLYLKRLLEKEGVKVKDDYEYMMRLCGLDILTLRVYRSSDNDSITVSFDRWGYVVDEFDGDVDQAPVEETLKAIRKWSNE